MMHQQRNRITDDNQFSNYTIISRFIHQVSHCCIALVKQCVGTNRYFERTTNKNKLINNKKIGRVVAAE